MKIPTYQDIIDEAASWRKTNIPDDLRRAEQILRQGLRDHPYALPIGDELALVLETQGKDDEAIQLLKELGHRYRDAGEETLCRFGKIYKKRADKLAAAGNPAAAIPQLLESERYYCRAYEKSYGFYPRINQLTARFLRAASAMRVDEIDEGEQLLLDVRDQAAKMLRDRAVWQERQVDDRIWIPATQGEVNLLLGPQHWSDSADAYRIAMRQACGRQFYFTCMKDQVKMLLQACVHLKIIPSGPLADPETFFANPQT